MQTAPPNWPADLTVSEPVARIDAGDVDGPRTDVEPDSWNVRREISSFFPEQVRGVSGQSVASANVDIPATDIEAQRARNPFAGTAQRVVESDIAIRAGFTGINGRAALVPVFTGRVMEASGSALSDVMSIDCDDVAASLRQAVRVPALAGTYQQQRTAVWGAGETLYPGVSGTWVMDLILRQLGKFATPVMNSLVRLSAPMQGSLWPDRGTLVYAKDWRQGAGINSDGLQPVFVPERWATGERFLAWTYTDDIAHEMDYIPSEPWGLGATRVAGWAKGDVGHVRIIASTVTPGSVTGGLQVVPTPTELIVAAGTGATLHGQHNFPWPQGRFSVDALQTGTNLAVTVHHEGGSSSTNLTVPADWGQDTVVRISVDLGFNAGPSMALAGLQVGTTNLGPHPVMDHVPSADLDPTLAVIGATPGVNVDDGWAAIREIAESELGAAWVNESGGVVYRNRRSLRGVGEVPHQITSRTSLMDLGWRESADQVRSSVRVPVLAIRNDIEDGEGVFPFTAWSASAHGENISIFERHETVRYLTLDVVAIGLDTEAVAGISATRTCYEAWTDQRGGLDGGLNVTSKVSVIIDQVGPSRIKVTLRNAYNGRVWLVDSQGNPLLRIGCRQAISQDDGPGQVVEVENPGVVGAMLELDPSPWIQTNSTARDLAEFLAAETARNKPMLQRVPVLWDPRRQLGDIVEISDPDVVGVAKLRGIIVAIEQGGSAGNVEQTLTIRPLSPTVADFDAEWVGRSIAEFNPFWAGRTVADFNADPLAS